MLLLGPPAARMPKSNFKSCLLTSSYGCTAEHVGIFVPIFNSVYIVSIGAAVRYKKQIFRFAVRGFKLHQSHIHYTELTPRYLCFDFVSHSIVISSTATTEDVSRSWLPDKKSFVHSAENDVSAELDKKLMKHDLIIDNISVPLKLRLQWSMFPSIVKTDDRMQLKTNPQTFHPLDRHKKKPNLLTNEFKGPFSCNFSLLHCVIDFYSFEAK